MIRRLAAIVAVMAPMALLIAMAEAKTRKTVHYTATVRDADVEHKNGFPAPGGSSLSAGVTDTRPGGRSAEILQTKVTGASGGGVTFTATSVGYTRTGAQFARESGTATPQPDGSTKVVGRGQTTGGTGAFRGATGSFTFTGTIPKADPATLPVGTLRVTGTLRY
jgi:hypothetical protein